MPTAERSLAMLLDEVHDGRIHVPEFQRELILRDDWIRSMLASVSLDYSIGAMMLLQSGSTELRFESSPLPGAPAASTQPEWLLIDGQCRLTALYQALSRDEPLQVLDADQPTQRWYYLDIDAAVDPDTDRDDAILSLDDRAPGENLFPLRLVFGDVDTGSRWQQRLSAPQATVVGAFRHFVVPIITLPRETTRWSVRVHGGHNGPALSDRYRAAALDSSSPPPMINRKDN